MLTASQIEEKMQLNAKKPLGNLHQPINIKKKLTSPLKTKSIRVDAGSLDIHRSTFVRKNRYLGLKNFHSDNRFWKNWAF